MFKIFCIGHNQQLEALTTRLCALENAVQQQESVLQEQSTVLRQILDNVSPARIPPEWEGRLKKLQDQVRNVSLWPKDADEAKRFLAQASELVADLPARAEPQYLPQLSPVRWAAMGFDRLNYPVDTVQTPDQLDQLVDELRALADAKPDGGAEALVQALGEHAAELAGEATERRITEAVGQAERYVEGSSGAAAEIAKLYEFLTLYEVGHKRDRADVDIPALRQRLYKEMLRRQAVEQAAILHDRWKIARKLEHHQPAVYEASTRMLLQQVVSARVALILEGVTSPVHDGLERELRSAVATIETYETQRAKKRQGRAVRAYQLWALSAIKKFEDTVQEISAGGAVRRDAEIPSRTGLGGSRPGRHGNIGLGCTPAVRGRLADVERPHPGRESSAPYADRRRNG